MADNHWDERYDDVRHDDIVPAPELPELDLQSMADQIEGGESADDRDVRREAERQARKDMYEIDKLEAQEQGISVSEFRQRRYDESQRQDEPEPEVAETDDPARQESDSIDSGDKLEKVIELLAAIAADTSQIRERLEGNGGNEVIHG